MHSPKIQEQELMLQLLQSKQNTKHNHSNGALGG